MKNTYGPHLMITLKRLMDIGNKIGRVIRFIFTTNRAIWFEKKLEGKQSSISSKISLIIDHDNTEEVISWLLQQKENWVVSDQEIDNAKTHHHFWLSARYNKAIIGSIKIGFDQIYISDFNNIYHFPKDMAFIYDTFVLKSYRNKGVAKALISEACQTMKEKGYKRIGCHIPPWNTPSIQAYKKNGFEQICFIRFIQLFGMQFSIKKFFHTHSEKRNKKLGKVTIPYESKNLYCP